MRVITLKDGRNITILNDRDLEDLIRDELGDEVGNKIRDLIKVKEDKKTEIESDLRYYEMELESREGALLEILDVTLELKEYIEDIERMNRNKILTLVDSIRNAVNNDI